MSTGVTSGDGNLVPGSPAPCTPDLRYTNSLQYSPILERTQDIIAIRVDVDQREPGFEDLFPSSQSIDSEKGISVLPASIRKQVYVYCFPTEQRKISLSPNFATIDVFPDGHFASPWDIIRPALGAIQSCALFRRELLTYFWTHYQFHVTFSIFTGPVFSPLSCVWLMENIKLVQHLTVEIDLARLGGSSINEPREFEARKLGQLLVGLINGISSSHQVTKMAELNFMCRRYSRFCSLGKFGTEDYELFLFSLHWS